MHLSYTDLINVGTVKVNIAAQRTKYSLTKLKTNYKDYGTSECKLNH
jgi:hypothetical protein